MDGWMDGCVEQTNLRLHKRGGKQTAHDREESEHQRWGEGETRRESRQKGEREKEMIGVWEHKTKVERIRLADTGGGTRNSRRLTQQPDNGPDEGLSRLNQGGL